MADDGVGAAGRQAPVGRDESERAAQGRQGQPADGETENLEAEASIDTPLQVQANGTEEHAGECAAEGKQPAARVPAGSLRWPADQEGNHEPELLGEETGPDELMRAQVELQGALPRKAP